MHLDLVDRWNDIDLVEEVLEVLLHEIRDADRPRAARRLLLLDRLICGDGAVELTRNGVVEQEQIDVVNSEPAQAAIEANERLVVAVVADPELGGGPPPARKDPQSPLGGFETVS